MNKHIIEVKGRYHALRHKLVNTLRGIKNFYRHGLAPRHFNTHREVIARYVKNHLSPNAVWIEKKLQDRYTFIDDNRLLITNGWYLKYLYQQALNKILGRHKIYSVLDVGSGRGEHTIGLAVRHPTLKFVGLEITESGIKAGKEFLKNPEPILQQLCFDIDSEPPCIENIEFIQGDAFTMPFADKSFDVSYTIVILKQLPHDYETILREMRRVTRKYCIFIEPFHEANNVWQRLKSRHNDQFRFRYTSFDGFEPVFFTTFPYKESLGMGLLLTRVL